MRRARRLLFIAFALSLLLHLLIALIVRPASPSRQNQTEVVSIEHRRMVIALTKRMPTPPPPKPRPVHTPAPAPAPRREKTPVAVAHGPHGGGGRGVATATPATPTPAPVPRPSPQGCAHPDAGAAVVATPSPPEIAPDARVSATSGTALVKVQLDPSGAVTDTSVTQTSGNSSLDLVAVAMARDARYTPALRDCKPIAGIYTFSVKFVAW
jgi:periplasmic protein TonB